jgi:hypothetical protein
MDQSKALNQISEAADLIAMLEALLNPANGEGLNASSLAGLRITLRNIRETMLKSHDSLAADLVARARARYESNKATNSEQAAQNSERENAQNAIKMQRRDLRSSIEKVQERA